MAAKALTPLGVIAKWVFIPAALAACGYFLIAPRMDTLLPSLQRPELPPPEVIASAEPEKQDPPAPEVEVKAEPARDTKPKEEPKRESRRRRRSNPVPIEPEPIKREEPEKNPAEHTGEGVSTEDPNSVDPAAEPPKPDPDPIPDPGGSAGGTGEEPPGD